MVFIVIYGYFGSLLSNLLIHDNNNNNNNINANNDSQNNTSLLMVTQLADTDNNNMVYNNNINETVDIDYRASVAKIKNKDDNDENKSQFVKNITSTELIIILWLTITYGSCLMLFLRFRVLKLERELSGDGDDHRNGKKREDSTDELSAFLIKGRKGGDHKQSFKQKDLVSNQPVVATDSNEPFWAHK
ncbi:probable serine/threonine-protein kinase clkA [Oppia nitens]|uniref:probable serine/threonine-protein kinase clkA n=1 Tax=Oppia nitens TaxID=1686743 RepID=UPI0023DBF627|nr:probable serine/threonine-protein kinase clkA [Oppia nitens]